MRKQLKLIKLRNTNKAFSGIMTITETPNDQLDILWQNKGDKVQLQANLSTAVFNIIIEKTGKREHFIL